MPEHPVIVVTTFASGAKIGAVRTRARGRAPCLMHPGKYSLRVSQFVFLSDTEIRRDQAIFKDLGNFREQVYRELRLPSTTEVFVYLFEDRSPFQKFLKAKYPELQIPRSFIAQPRRIGGAEDLMIYTYLGDRVQQSAARADPRDAALRPEAGSILARRRPGRNLRGAWHPGWREPEASRRVAQAWPSIQPGSPGEAQEVQQIEPGRLPQIVGVGPPDAAKHAASQASPARLSARSAPPIPIPAHCVRVWPRPSSLTSLISPRRTQTQDTTQPNHQAIISPYNNDSINLRDTTMRIPMHHGPMPSSPSTICAAARHVLYSLSIYS